MKEKNITFNLSNNSYEILKYLSISLNKDFNTILKESLQLYFDKQDLTVIQKRLNEKNIKVDDFFKEL